MIEGFLAAAGGFDGDAQHLLELALADVVRQAARTEGVLAGGRGGDVPQSIGPVAGALTTNLNINFLRPPGPADLIADGRVLKLGKRLAVSEVLLFSEGQSEPVAHVTGTYSIPPSAIDAVT